jgi:GGDEF domain-containing protein
MFSSKKEKELEGKIRLPKRDSPPGMEHLKEVLGQAYGKMGREVEARWSENVSHHTYSLVVKVEREGTLPSWTLWEDDGQQTHCTWRYETNDLTLISDMLHMRQPSGLGQAAGNPSNKAPDFGQSPKPGQNLADGGAGQSRPGNVGGNPRSSFTGAAYQPPSDRLSDERTGHAPGPLQSQFKKAAHAGHPGGQGSAPGRPISSEFEEPDGSAGLTEELGSDSFSAPGAAGKSAGAPTAASQAEAAARLQAELNAQFEGSPAAAVRNTIGRATRALLGPVADEMRLTSATTIEGNFERLQVATLLQALSMAQVAGKLEIIGDESVGRVYFASGTPVHATTDANVGDSAICELVAWRNGIFRFFIDDTTTVRSVQNRLDANVMDGIALLDQKRHLEEAGLTHESYILRKHKKLSDSELKVFLMKGQDVDFNLQAEVYRAIGQRCTLADLLRDRPMESLTWTRVLYNFLTCGLIEIKPPEAVSRAVLEFLGDAQAGVQAIMQSMLRPETNIYNYHALLYLLEYEFYRFESYGWPITLVLLELNKKNNSGGLDSISAPEATVAANRIELVKRPLDSLAHFEAIHYALLLPNTKAASGAYVANRILQALLATPISPTVDRKSLHVAMGIASLPSDGEDIEALILEAKNALARARDGDFPIVLASSHSKPQKLL